MAMSQSILGQRIDGIWHTGIIAYSREYYFGGGIQVSQLGYFARSHQLQPTQVLDMGTTTKTQAELEQFLRSVNHQFTQRTYNLITNNCNNFADAVCQFLTGHGIPNHIVDLPRIVFSTPGGAMLRPMIEGMQNNIMQQNGSGMDPFGASGRQAPAQFESTLSDSIQGVGLNMVRSAAQPEAQVPAAMVPPAKASLEEQALISGDASTVQVIGRKILNLPGADGVAGAALNENDKALLTAVLEELSTAAQAVPASAAGAGAEGRFSLDAYALLERVIAEHPSAHMSCLFVLRLMLLHDRATEYDKLSIVKEVLRRLISHTRGDGSVAADSKLEGFASVPAHVLALCSISNLLSHEAGADYLVYGNKDVESRDNFAHVSNLIDIALSGLSHSRAEIRQMSATLAYNYTLLCTKENKLSGMWSAQDTVDELNPHALQLLCGSLEGLLQESDAGVRRRRLAIICRILRAYGAPAVQLVNDLGFQVFLLSLCVGVSHTVQRFYLITCIASFNL